MSETAHEVAFYNGADNDYDLDKDPRCLWGWGPPSRGCTCMFGHACFREVGHPGECWDAGGPLEPIKYRRKCDTAQRPKSWDAKLREECNR